MKRAPLAVCSASVRSGPFKWTWLGGGLFLQVLSVMESLWKSTLTPKLFLLTSYSPALPFLALGFALPSNLYSPSSFPFGPPLLVNPLPSALWTEDPVWKLGGWHLWLLRPFTPCTYISSGIPFLPAHQGRKPGHQTPQCCSHLHITTVCCSSNTAPTLALHVPPHLRMESTLLNRTCEAHLRSSPGLRPLAVMYPACQPCRTKFSQTLECFPPPSLLSPRNAFLPLPGFICVSRTSVHECMYMTRKDLPAYLCAHVGEQLHMG